MRKYMYTLIILLLSLSLVVGCATDDKKKDLDEVTPPAQEAPAENPAAPPAAEPNVTEAPAEDPVTPPADDSAKTEPTDNPATPDPNASVAMTVDITGKGEMTVVVLNNSDVDVSTAQGFVLEKQVGEDDWEIVDLGLAFTEDIVVIAPKEKHEFKYQLPEDFSFEADTTYRVVKHVSDADGTELTLAAPFDVK